MNKLLIFEYKRIKKTKTLYLVWILCIVIAVLGMILNEVFNGGNAAPAQKMLSIFNSYTQFSYLILGFLFVSTFTKDNSNGVSFFYKQLGYTYKTQYICKSVVLFLCTVPLINIITLICNFIYKNTDWKYLITMLISITLSHIYIILLASLVSLCFKTTLKTVLIFYGLFVIFNILNIFGLGLINPADGNSITTYCFSNWNETLMHHYSLDKVSNDVLKNKELICCIEPFLWCLLLTVIDTLLLKKKNRS